MIATYIVKWLLRLTTIFTLFTIAVFFVAVFYPENVAKAIDIFQGLFALN